MKKIIIIVFILIAIVAGGYYYVQQILRDPAKLVDKLPEIAKHLEFELDNVRYGHTRLGVKKWELSTRKAKRIKGQKNILLEGVTARIYADGKLKGDTRIQADKGSYLVDSGDMELQGAVIIENKQFNIATGRLLYRADSEQIEAPEKVSVESERLNIKANRALIDLKQQQLHFVGAVKASIRLDKEAVVDEKPESVKLETFNPESVEKAIEVKKLVVEKESIPIEPVSKIKKRKRVVRHKIIRKPRPEVKIRKPGRR